jgi:hypothetical protein
MTYELYQFGLEDGERAYKFISQAELPTEPNNNDLIGVGDQWFTVISKVFIDGLLTLNVQPFPGQVKVMR